MKVRIQGRSDTVVRRFGIEISDLINLMNNYRNGPSRPASLEMGRLSPLVKLTACSVGWWLMAGVGLF
jgi:hypothetical protein